MKKEKKYLVTLAVASLFLSSGFVFAEDGAMNPPPLGVKGDLDASVELQGGAPMGPRPGIIKDLRGDIKGIRRENAGLRDDNRKMREEFRDERGEHEDESSDDRKEGRREMKDKIKDNREEMKDNKDQIEAKRAELKNELHLKMQVRFDALVNRFDKLAGRIQSRIDQMKTEGTDITKAQADLDLAIKSLADLKAKVSATVIVQGDDQATKDANKASLDEIKALSKKVKDALMTASYDLAPMKKA